MAAMPRWAWLTGRAPPSRPGRPWPCAAAPTARTGPSQGLGARRGGLGVCPSGRGRWGGCRGRPARRRPGAALRAARRRAVAGRSPGHLGADGAGAALAAAVAAGLGAGAGELVAARGAGGDPAAVQQVQRGAGLGPGRVGSRAHHGVLAFWWYARPGRVTAAPASLLPGSERRLLGELAGGLGLAAAVPDALGLGDRPAQAGGDLVGVDLDHRALLALGR